jgi:plastocyanin
MNRILIPLAFVLACAALAAEEVTLPAAASIVGGAPFFSDVRAFNTSYTQSLTVSARYRCFIPQPCNPATQSVNFTLTPRESRAFNDIVVSLFNAPNTAGGIEFEHSGLSDQLVVTSRLFSTSPTPTVGMFIPGLDNSEAHATTVLTSIRNGGAGQGFRSNVGAFNREDSPVNVTFTIFDGGAQVGVPVTRTVAGHSGVQVNAVFAVANAPTHVTENAVIVVAASHEVFSYAAVIDNTTTDPIFIVGAEDGPPPAAAQRIVQVGQGGSNFKDEQGGGSVTTIRPGDTVKWVWSGTMRHGVASGTCTNGGGGYGDDGSCNPDRAFSSGSHQGPFTYSFTFTEAGNFAYYCPVHGAGMKGRVLVELPGGAAVAKKNARTRANAN